MLEFTLAKAIIKRGVYKLMIIYRRIYKQLLKKNLLITVNPYFKI